jgi:hypothetical protein
VSLIPARRASRSTSQEPASTLIIPVDEEDEENDDGMEVEEFDEPEAEASLIVGEQEVEAMVGLDDTEAEEAEKEETAKVATASKPPRIWPDVSTDRAARYRREVDAIREVFEDEVDVYDTTMVSEYAEDIFDYMGKLEVGCFVSVCTG